eukprot:gene30561-34495_t
MLNDPDSRKVDDVTAGDFIALELFDAGTWRAYRISRTALEMLDACQNLSPLDAFEKCMNASRALHLMR